MLFDLTEKDLENLPTTVSITGQIAKTHFGLGDRTAFLKVCDCANMGVLQVGNSGVGKTMCLRALMRMPHRKMFSRQFTMAGVKEAFNKYFTDSEVSWINLEFAHLTELVLDNLLRVACSILSDNACQVSTSAYDCDIDNSRISFLAACTWEKFNLLWQSPMWRGNFRDRIMPFSVFAFKRKDVNPEIPFADVRFNMPDFDEVKCEKDVWFKWIVQALETHFTSERSFEYAQRLLRGSAMLNHRDYTVPADGKFILMHKFNVEAESLVSKRRTLTSPLQMNTDALFIFGESLKRFGIEIRELEKSVFEPESVRKALDDYSYLFMKKAGMVFPKFSIISKEIIPQINFEKRCMEVA